MDGRYFELNIAIALVLAYLIGAIPSSVWIGRMFFGVDVRQKGSGNAGATNTIRVLGAKAGIPVLAIDVFKGWLAVYLAHFFAPPSFEQFELTNFKIILALIATLGHIFPVYVGFKGGKGVATMVGILIALYPDTILLVIGIFILVFALFKYVSLASIVAAICFPFIVYFLSNEHHTALIIFSIAVAIFIPVTHKKNVQRLLKGEERKFTLRKTKA